MQSYKIDSPSTSIRSGTYQKMYSDKNMLDAFGTLTPTRSERTTYFFDLWMEWRSTRALIDKRKETAVQRLLLDIGLKEFWEFQVRAGEVRFATEEDKGFALVSGLREYTQDYSGVKNV
jgi:hypothetical protein|tara:strand:- start:22386 stop:22742 length:357 start_codon:yes stop_codon:yes gene_type:complete